MTSRVPLFLAVCWLVPIAALAAEPPAPAPAPATAPKPGKVSIQFQGTLREALKKIAADGGLNLIITGNLDDPTEVMLRDASPEEALETVARLHHLETARQGSIWTVRRMTATEQEEAAKAGEKSDEEKSDGEENDEESDEAAESSVPSVPPVPPLGPGQLSGRVQENLQHQQEKLRRQQEKLQRKLIHKFGKGHGLSGTGSVIVAEGQTVDDAVAFGGNLTVDGHVQGDAVAFGGSVHLGKTAVVDGDVTAFGGEVTRDEGSEVEGDVTSFGSPSLGKAIASTVKQAHDEDEEENAGSHSHSSGIPGFILRFALLFGVGFLGLMFIPERMKQLEDDLRRDPLRCGLVGLVGALALIPLSILLTVTLIGILPMILLWMMVLLGVVLGIAALASEIGLRLPILRGRKTQAIVLAVGLLVLLLVGQIPVLGVLTSILIALMALGAVIRTRFGGRRQGIPQPT